MKKTQNAKDAKFRLLTERRKMQTTQKLVSEWRTKTQKCELAFQLQAYCTLHPWSNNDKPCGVQQYTDPVHQNAGPVQKYAGTMHCILKVSRKDTKKSYS